MLGISAVMSMSMFTLMLMSLVKTRLYSKMNVQLKKISIPTPRKALGNSEEEESLNRQNQILSKEKKKEGTRVKPESLPWKRGWIFYRTTQLNVMNNNNNNFI